MIGKKYCYICGPITGIDGGNVDEFARVAQVLRMAGVTPINPHEICADIPVNSAHPVYMLRCLKYLITLADCVVVLDGWAFSKGSNHEISVANAIDIPVFLTVDAAINYL